MLDHSTFPARSAGCVWDATAKVWRRVLKSMAFAAIAASSAACLVEQEPPDHGPPFEALPCGSDIALPLSGLAEELDSLESGWATTATHSTNMLAGTPCAGATLPGACNAKREALIVEAAQPKTPCVDVDPCVEVRYTITTKGDDVRLIPNSAEALHAVLGDIDTVAEAAFVLGVRGAQLSCDSQQDELTYRLVPKGVEVQSRNVISFCRWETGNVVRLVARDATVRVVRSAVTDVDPTSCVPVDGPVATSQ